MFTVRRTDVFKVWLDGLKDRRAAARVRVRVLRLEDGNLGDVKPVGGGVSELRIDYGPGYRVYFTQPERAIILLICGGEKKGQSRDIATAKRIAKELKE